MHPAFSIILFTTTTGAGYGLLALLGFFVSLKLIPSDAAVGFAGLGVAVALVTLGLLASTGHLGHRERAYLAFSQWRSSWLSREGVAAVITYVFVGLLFLGWVILGWNHLWIAVAGLLTAASACATVCATAMIYASLKPIAQWRSRFTLPGYLIFSAMTGSLFLNAILQIFNTPPQWLLIFTCLLTATGWAWKTSTWRHNDLLSIGPTENSAIGLPGGRLHSIEWPHTEENYVLKEMGYRVARKHAQKLRLFVHVVAFGVPLVLLIAAMLANPLPAKILSLVAASLQFCGMLVERWLFFAEAKHTVMLYYGR